MGALAKSMFALSDEKSFSLLGDARHPTANWIGEGSVYEFRLYDSDHTELLAKRRYKSNAAFSLNQMPPQFSA